MKNDIYLTLEKSDLKIQEELDFGEVPYFVDACIETFFDVDKKFGLNLKDSDGVWVNLYAKYNPCDNQFRVDYVVSSSDSNVWRVYQPTQGETNMIQTLIEEACIKQTGHTCKDEFIRRAMEEADEINLVCEKVSETEYQIRNTWDDLVVHTEDETGKLKDHVGHKIEYAKYEAEDGYSFSVECMDCNEVLFAQTDDPQEEVAYAEGVYEYGEYRIVVSPDYRKAIDAGDAPEEIYCEVFVKTDVEYKNGLGEFNMMLGYEYDDTTVESIEEGINKLMDESISFYELQRKEAEFSRANELLARSVSYVAELSGTENLRETLIEKLGMTEEEADNMAQEFEMDIEAEQGMTLG